MMRLLFAKVLPLGLTGAFLQSSVSPIKPALNAFMAATDALAGKSTANSGADFEAMLQDQLKNGAVPGIGGKAPEKPKPENAKDQLNDIIAQVKGQTAEMGAAGSGVGKAVKAAKTAQKSSKHTEPEKPKDVPVTGPETSLTAVSGK
jgi:hypothetical protein